MVATCACFVPITVSQTGCQSVTPSGTIQAVVGTNQQIIVTPGYKCSVTNVNVNGVDQANPVSSYTFVNVQT